MANILYVTNPCYIKLDSKELLKIEEQEKESRNFPMDSISTIVLESDRSTITTKALNRLAKNNIVVIICDDKGMPSSHFMNYTMHHFSAGNMMTQFNNQEGLKHVLWQKIIERKIWNQALVLEFLKCDKDVIDRLKRVSPLVEKGDIRNREAVEAKKFFSELHGPQFIRHAKDITNYSLDFGYHILASQIAKVVCGYGLLPSYGINHRGKTNYWNLVYDLIEVVRPIVDYWTSANYVELKNKLTKENKAGLLSLLNANVMFNGQKRILSSCIVDYVESFLACLRKEDAENLKMPELIDLGW